MIFEVIEKTREAVSCLQSSIIMEKSLRLSNEIILAFIDVKKAFDNVDWNIRSKCSGRRKESYLLALQES